MNTIGILRISTKTQNLEVQRHELTQFAQDNGLNIIDWVEMDGISAYHDIPNALDIAINQLECHRYPDQVNVLLFSDVDRLSRNVENGLKIYERIHTLGIRMRFAREPQLDLSTPEGRHLFRMKLSQAQLESDKISERVHAANISKRFLGQPIGASPYGYHTIRGVRCANPQETAVLMILMMLYGDYTTGQILDAIYNYHLIFAPDDIEKDGYAIYRGEQIMNRDEIFYGDEDDFASILNTFGLIKRGRKWTNSMIKYANNTYIEKRYDELCCMAPEPMKGYDSEELSSDISMSVDDGPLDRFIMGM